MNDQPSNAAVEKYTARQLDARRLGVIASALVGFGLAGLGYTMTPGVAVFVGIAAGACLAAACIAAWPWLSGAVESRSAQRDQGGW